jgi:hypothetical protein
VFFEEDIGVIWPCSVMVVIIMTHLNFSSMLTFINENNPLCCILPTLFNFVVEWCQLVVKQELAHPLCEEGVVGIAFR